PRHGADEQRRTTRRRPGATSRPISAPHHLALEPLPAEEGCQQTRVGRQDWAGRVHHLEGALEATEAKGGYRRGMRHHAVPPLAWLAVRRPGRRRQGRAGEGEGGHLSGRGRWRRGPARPHRLRYHGTVTTETCSSPLK